MIINNPGISYCSFKIGESCEQVEACIWVIWVPANLAGIPAISIPCGFTKDGLPLECK